MHNLAENFLTKAEQEQVTAIVHEVERSTSGEIVPMIVSRSHDYPLAAAICSLSLCIPLGLLLTHLLGPRLWVGPQNMWLFLALCSVGFAIFYALVSQLDWVKHFFLNHKQVEQEVREGALAAFYEEKLYKTADENGILLYISVLEQKVWILADAGINTKIDRREWDAVVADLTAGIKAGKRCQAICQAVKCTGEILRTHFPHQRDDRDELHNLIIR